MNMYEPPWGRGGGYEPKKHNAHYAQGIESHRAGSKRGWHPTAAEGVRRSINPSDGGVCPAGLPAAVCLPVSRNRHACTGAQRTAQLARCVCGYRFRASRLRLAIVANVSPGRERTIGWRRQSHGAGAMPRHLPGLAVSQGVDQLRSYEPMARQQIVCQRHSGGLGYRLHLVFLGRRNTEVERGSSREVGNLRERNRNRQRGLRPLVHAALIFSARCSIE